MGNKKEKKKESRKLSELLRSLILDVVGCNIFNDNLPFYKGCVNKMLAISNGCFLQLSPYTS
jgi:hypothetical protein